MHILSCLSWSYYCHWNDLDNPYYNNSCSTDTYRFWNKHPSPSFTQNKASVEGLKWGIIIIFVNEITKVMWKNSYGRRKTNLTKIVLSNVTDCLNKLFNISHIVSLQCKLSSLCYIDSNFFKNDIFCNIPWSN